MISAMMSARFGVTTMVSCTNLAAFALVALGMVLTPGPNMVYLITRSIMQGRRAGLISLCGVILGFCCYMVCAALGLTALLLAVPFAYESIQWAGAAYLLYLAWNAVKPGARSVLAPRSDLVPEGAGSWFYCKDAEVKTAAEVRAAGPVRSCGGARRRQEHRHQSDCEPFHALQPSRAAAAKP